MRRFTWYYNSENRNSQSRNETKGIRFVVSCPSIGTLNGLTYQQREIYFNHRICKSVYTDNASTIGLVNWFCLILFFADVGVCLLIGKGFMFVIIYFNLPLDRRLISCTSKQWMLLIDQSYCNRFWKVMTLIPYDVIYFYYYCFYCT